MSRANFKWGAGRVLQNQDKVTKASWQFENLPEVCFVPKFPPIFHLLGIHPTQPSNAKPSLPWERPAAGSFLFSAAKLHSFANTTDTNANTTHTDSNTKCGEFISERNRKILFCSFFNVLLVKSYYNFIQSWFSEICARFQKRDNSGQIRFCGSFSLNTTAVVSENLLSAL